ncbi:hypothetical protein BD410DRAFT_792067 [Rickenella mellea]|uniref:Uncharacterized protein n=1 Tax=Rickenella mellea TaxID=50990 RepID=A0A4Y7PY56_9AGAM|nr:hypothetical protein BD410DRAFT_792067 [Rickenella mellea]
MRTDLWQQLSIGLLGLPHCQSISVEVTEAPSAVLDHGSLGVPFRGCTMLARIKVDGFMSAFRNIVLYSRTMTQMTSRLPQAQ